MTITIEQTTIDPNLGLGENEIPEKVWVLKAGTRYVCYKHGTLHGLAVFSSEALAVTFNAANGVPYAVTAEVSFDEAREIAKSRPAQVVCLMLLDDINKPVIHYVR